MSTTIIPQSETERNITALLSPDRQAMRLQLLTALRGGTAVIGRAGSFLLVTTPGPPQIHQVLTWYNRHFHCRQEHCNTCSGELDVETYYLLNSVDHNAILPCDHILVARLHLLDGEHLAAILETDPELAAAWHIQQQGGIKPPTPAPVARPRKATGRAYVRCNECGGPVQGRGRTCADCRDQQSVRYPRPATSIIAPNAAFHTPAINEFCNQFAQEVAA